MSESPAIPSPEQFRVVLVTVPDEASAEKIARTVVEERLAACANCIPGVQSIFHWQGSLDRAAEILLVFKTRAQCFDALARRVEELHPYAVPEVLGLPVAAGNAAYLRWLAEETAP